MAHDLASLRCRRLLDGALTSAELGEPALAGADILMGHPFEEVHMNALALAAILFLATPAQEPYVHESPRFELTLPSAEWEVRDMGGGSVLALVFTPVEDMTTRCSVLRYPGSFLPEGLETREVQIRAAAGELYSRVSLGLGRIAGREARRLEYTIAGGTTIEWGFEEGGDHVIFQLAAPAAVWDDPQERAALEAVRDSFAWTGGKVRGPVDRTPPDEIRAGRAVEAGAARPFEVTRHRIAARIEPAEHALAVRDTIDLVAREDGLAEVRLYTTLVTVEDVTSAAPISWRVETLPQADVLVVSFDPPLAAGAAATLDVSLACDEFFQGTDQDLVAEIGVLGQIRPRSSWSSHVLWYPMDKHNDAAVDVTFDVPAPLVALTGGELVERVEEEGRARCRYVEESRVPRPLPFGFAVGDYRSRTVESEGGLSLSAWGFAGEEKRIDQRVEILSECAAAFERALGPLPWSVVRFVHVDPERKETGVSLPGMILVSDSYFPDLEGVDASSGNLSDPGVLGLLVVADELSHQWNFYSTGFPNELAEGISTYTNTLFLEERYGEDAYRRAIRYCRDAWIESADESTEYAIANPAVYSNTRYRSVVFCKTPVALDALRRRLGDEVFFAGLRRAFALRDRSVDGFERLERGFEEAAKAELRPFFDQWFFRAGFPELEVAHERTRQGARVTVRQAQDEEPYELLVEISIECADGSTHMFPVTMTEREQSFDLELPAAPAAVHLGPDGRLPARLAKE